MLDLEQLEMIAATANAAILTSRSTSPAASTTTENPSPATAL